MAVVSMGGTGDENGGNPIFHDFLGMSHGEAPPAVRSKGGVGDGSRDFKVLGIADARASISASAGASSGERGFVSRSSDLGSGAEVNNHFSGRKRANSDSGFMGFPRERTAPMASGSPESSSRLKMVPKEDPREKQRRSSDGAVFGTQPPPRLNSTSVIIHQPLAGRADPAGSKWEQSMPLNSGAMMHYTSCYGQNIMQRDKLSSCTYKDATTSIPLISQAAADEGSRTGTKSGRVLNAINSGVVSGERKSAGALHCIDKTMASPRITESDPSNTLSRSTLSTANRQMTIFYAGQAHVFDDVPPNKADVIMTLAGSDGGSWSTSFSPKSTVRPPASGAKPPVVEETVISNSSFPQDLSRRLSLQGIASPRLGQPLRFPASGDRAAREMRPTNMVEADAEARRTAP